MPWEAELAYSQGEWLSHTAINDREFSEFDRAKAVYPCSGCREAR